MGLILAHTLDSYFDITKKAWEHTDNDLVCISEELYYINYNDSILTNYLTYYVKFI